MRLQLFGASALLACMVLSHAAQAQQAAESMAVAPPAVENAEIVPGTPSVPPCCTLPALTVVELEIVDPASSRTSHIGDRIKIRAAEPIAIEGTVVIPAGTEGYAEVIQASKARMMGKAGELTLGMPYLELQGQRVPLKRMRYGRSSGHSATTETMVATALVGIAGLVISGGNVDIQSGARANAVVAAEIKITMRNTEF